MSDSTLGPGPRSRVRRLPAKASYQRDVIYQILDEAPFCHVAAIVDGQAMALPTLHVRREEYLYVHGSQSNAVMASIVDAGTAFVTATLYDGLRLARSGFESSIAYRSVVVVGAAVAVADGDEKRAVLSSFVDQVLPGRGSEVRPMSDQEVRLTSLVRVTINEASAKISSGPTDDPLDDQALDIWSGTVPARLVYDTPVADTNGAMASGRVAIPDSVRQLLGNQ